MKLKVSFNDGTYREYLCERVDLEYVNEKDFHGTYLAYFSETEDYLPFYGKKKIVSKMSDVLSFSVE